MKPVATNDSRSAIERTARDMAERWRNGERPLAETYLDRFPELWLNPAAALELIAEELALRTDHDCPTSPSQLTRRFPQWSEQVLALLECQQLLGTQPFAPRFPAPGELLGGFHLVAELGHGAHGRVFLAHQSTLAKRPVVLKLSPDTGTEHLALARLQHSHIVPLYSAHEFPDRGLRGLCLPYFGGLSLADIQKRLAESAARSGGCDLLAAIGGDAPAAGPARDFLNQASAEDAVCWIGACLADALQYAHDRRVLHLDLKPSNVLLAADGVPMLLDFHLARPPLEVGSAPPPWLGGTPGYMAPEQSFALDAVRDSRPISRALDGRADIYSLGVLLRELLQVLVGTERISAGLADILNRCTAPLATGRYLTAAALAADFRRHLGNLPLKGVGNRSLVERFVKWRRRRPFALPLGLALGALIATGTAFGLHGNRLAERARFAERTGAAHLARGQFDEALEAYRSGEVFIEGMPFQRSLRSELQHGVLSAERARTAVELHRFCERARPLFDAELISSEQARRVRDRCRELWERRDALAAAMAGQPAPELERQCRADLLDLAILTAHLDDPAKALATLEVAEKLLGESAALFLERARHARALGFHEIAAAATRRGQAITPNGPWDNLAIGRSWLAAGDLERAAPFFERCAEIDPRNFWAHYYTGVCALKQKQAVAAIAAFSAACALAPDAAWCFYNRGLAFTEAERFESALADFARALVLDPGLAAAHLGRSTVQMRDGRYPEALAELDRAGESGIALAEVLYRKALVLLASGDRPSALARLRECLRHEPAHRAAAAELARLTGQ